MPGVVTRQFRFFFGFSLCLAISANLGGCSRSNADAETAFQRGNYEASLSLWRERAQHGDAFAQNFMGVHYHLGLGVAPDYVSAVKWYTLAAENGNGDAQRNLGTILLATENNSSTRRAPNRSEPVVLLIADSGRTQASLTAALY